MKYQKTPNARTERNINISLYVLSVAKSIIIVPISFGSGTSKRGKSPEKSGSNHDARTSILNFWFSALRRRFKAPLKLFGSLSEEPDKNFLRSSGVSSSKSGCCGGSNSSSSSSVVVWQEQPPLPFVPVQVGEPFLCCECFSAGREAHRLQAQV